MTIDKDTKVKAYYNVEWAMVCRERVKEICKGESYLCFDLYKQKMPKRMKMIFW